MEFTNGEKYNTIYADPPWQFQNRAGKVAPEHKRLTRYETMTIEDIKALPIADITGEKSTLIFVGSKCAAPGWIGSNGCMGI